MSNTLILNTFAALLLSCLLIAFHFITFSVFTPGLSFFNDLLSNESRIIFSLEFRRNYLYIFKYLIPILVNLILPFWVVTMRMKFNLMIDIKGIIFICFFPWAAYYLITLIISLLAVKDTNWQNINQLFLIKDVVFTFSNSALTIVGGTLAYSTNSFLYR